MRSLLHYAVMEENSFVVEILVTNDANVNASDVNGMTPLHYSVLYKAEVGFSFLSRISLKLSQISHPPKQNSASVLLKKGARAHARDITGRSAEDLAKEIGAEWFLQLLYPSSSLQQLQLINVEKELERLELLDDVIVSAPGMITVEDVKEGEEGSSSVRKMRFAMKFNQSAIQETLTSEVLLDDSDNDHLQPLSPTSSRLAEPTPEPASKLQNPTTPTVSVEDSESQSPIKIEKKRDSGITVNPPSKRNPRWRDTRSNLQPMDPSAALPEIDGHSALLVSESSSNDESSKTGEKDCNSGFGRSEEWRQIVQSKSTNPLAASSARKGSRVRRYLEFKAGKFSGSENT